MPYDFDLNLRIVYLVNLLGFPVYGRFLPVKFTGFGGFDPVIITVGGILLILVFDQQFRAALYAEFAKQVFNMEINS
jgi:hypothetical protein